MTSLARTRLALSLFSLLFLARVAGQGIMRVAQPSWLPPDPMWHAGLVPYSALLGIQLVLLALMAMVIARLDRIRQNDRLSMVVAGVGSLYLVVMAGRFAVGASGLVPGGWFDRPISTTFHLVLAGWLLILAQHLGTAERRALLSIVARRFGRAMAYPAVMALACGLFLWLRRHGAPVAFSAYLPVILGASAILVMELAAPYRRQWLPDREVVLQDAVYLIVVQVALPSALTLAIAGLAAQAVGGGAGLWPTNWPIAAQAALMLVSADFLRYWLHRACHGWPALWRLHAVHHSPGELYFLNVGRFHPLEKSIQFLLDAAPFILLGISQEVVAAYFVFYAVNGFFQHSNADVHLGHLNWIIAGPELHRWHHSRIVAESNHNFGNNLILWDTVFGTRFLPPREVGELGLVNRAYPEGFLAQTLAPDPNRPSDP